MWSLKTDGLLTHVNYSPKWAFWSLQRRSLNTGGLKCRFDCTCAHGMSEIDTYNAIKLKEFTT